jgi:hypothetical protein
MKFSINLAKDRVSIGFKIKASFDENKRNETEILRIKLIKD